MRMSLALFGLVAAIATPALAAGPFDGTWKIDIGSADFSKKPDVILLKDGVYDCTTCTPRFTVKADGSFHPLKDIPYVDEAAIKIVDARTIEETDKLKGKIVGRQRITLAADGATQTISFTDLSAPDGKPVTGEQVQARVAPAPAGAHALSGSWRTNGVAGVSDAALTTSFRQEGDMIMLSTPNGYGYTATLGGPAVPYVGDNSGLTARVAMVDGTTLEETDIRKGEIVQLLRLTPAADGKTLAAVNENRKSGRTTRFTLVRQ